MITNPTAFHNPHGLRNKVARVLWNVVYLLGFRFTPRLFLGAWRSFVLRCFGARIKWARFHPSVRIWAPWLLEVGEDVYVAEGVHLYNQFGIQIGNRVVISQDSFLCGASHDFTVPNYPLIGNTIVIEDDCWIAADVFIAQGITVGTGAVVGARACVFKNVEPWTVVGGNPARFLKARELRSTPPTETGSAAAEASAKVGVHEAGPETLTRQG